MLPSWTSVTDKANTRWAEVACLVVLALLIPVPLYLVSLALFGLPHIVWELGYLARRYQKRWSWKWWAPVSVFLALQACARLAVWQGHYAADVGQIADLAALMGLAACLVLAPTPMHWSARLGALTIMLTLLWLLQEGEWLMALLVLAIAHNFTPLGFALDLARSDARQRHMVRELAMYFGLPILVAVSGVSWHDELHIGSGQARLLSQQVPASWRHWGHEDALMSAVALAQCLHYAAVLRWLPAAVSGPGLPPLIGLRVRWLTGIVVATMLLYYLKDYTAARQLYSVAAGLHAWLEWPILLMVLWGQHWLHPSRRHSHEIGRTR